MAIEPATLKMAAKAAIKVLTDEEARKKMIMIALAPVIGVIVLIALIFQIIRTHPQKRFSKVAI